MAAVMPLVHPHPLRRNIVDGDGRGVDQQVGGNQTAKQLLGGTLAFQVLRLGRAGAGHAVHRLDGFHHGGQVIGLRGLFAGVAQAVQTFQGNTLFSCIERSFPWGSVSGFKCRFGPAGATHRLRSSGGRAAGRQQSRHTVWFSGMRPLRVYLW